MFRSSGARRWLLLLSLGTAGLSPLLAQSRLNRPPPEYLQLSPPDQAEGARTLEEFRSRRLAAGYFLDFEVRVRPRRGPERVLLGALWGAPQADGTASRVELGTAGAAPEARSRLLLINGPQPEAWTLAEDGRARPLTTAEVHAPLQGTPLSVFELQMPFLYWTDFVYEGVTRHRGRPAHRFVVYPPAAEAESYPELQAVRMYLDGQFTALLQAEVLGPDHTLRKTITVGDLKRLDGEWLVKSVDVRDDLTRDKARFEVRGAALQQDFLPLLFEPEALGRTPARPEGVTRFAD